MGQIRFSIVKYAFAIPALWMVFIAKGQAPVMSSLSDTIAYYRSTAKPMAEFNSEAVDYAPSISADGKTMIIESNREGRYQLYESHFADGSWSPLKPIDEINNFGDSTDLIGGPSLSFDGNLLFFFASFREGLGSEDIYYSVRDGQKWTKPQNIGAPVNSSQYEGFPSISADGNTLYFVRQDFDGPTDKELSQEWGSKTCYSILRSHKNPNGTWSTPELLPYPINQECEKAPRIMADNKTLIFASNRMGGLGDYDLYQTQLDEVGDWKMPRPLEFINTSSSDQFCSISAQGDKLYYVYDSKDIYMVEIPPHLRQFKNNILQGYIRNGDTGEGMSAELIVSDAFTSRELVHLTNNPNDGRYTVVLAVGSNYNIEVKRDGYTSQSYFFDLINKDEYEEIDQDIELYPSAKLSLNIYDVDIFEPMMANVIISEKGATSASKELVSPVDGKLELDLPLGKTYEIRIEKENFEMESFTLDVSGLVVYRDFAHDVEMMPIKRQVEINIADLTNNGKIKSRVRIRNQSRDEVILVEGNQTVALRVGDRYEIEATSDQGYAFNSTVIEVTPEGQEVKVRGEEGGRDIDLSVGIQLNLQPLVVGTDLTLKDILFDSNSDHLDEISYTELQRVVELMMENPTLRVEIDAHTDDVGSDVYNQNLSERRAESVVRFLIENKIDKGRFVARGLGESEPDFPNDTEENRAKNRRVVLKILTI